MFKKIIIIILIIGFLLPTSSLSIEPPKTLEEAKEVTKEVIDVAEEKMPGILERIWRKEVIPVWRAMWEWFRVHIWSRIERIWQRIQELLGKEAEKRIPLIEEELEREKEEIKKELPEVGRSLWERFKELIK